MCAHSRAYGQEPAETDAQSDCTPPQPEGTAGSAATKVQLLKHVLLDMKQQVSQLSSRCDDLESRAQAARGGLESWLVTASHVQVIGDLQQLIAEHAEANGSASENCLVSHELPPAAGSVNSLADEAALLFSDLRHNGNEQDDTTFRSGWLRSAACGDVRHNGNEQEGDAEHTPRELLDLRKYVDNLKAGTPRLLLAIPEEFDTSSAAEASSSQALPPLPAAARWSADAPAATCDEGGQALAQVLAAPRAASPPPTPPVVTPRLGFGAPVLFRPYADRQVPLLPLGSLLATIGTPGHKSFQVPTVSDTNGLTHAGHSGLGVAAPRDAASSRSDRATLHGASERVDDALRNAALSSSRSLPVRTPRPG